jgi:hypothetical protein
VGLTTDLEGSGDADDIGVFGGQAQDAVTGSAAITVS